MNEQRDADTFRGALPLLVPTLLLALALLGALARLGMR